MTAGCYFQFSRNLISRNCLELEVVSLGTQRTLVGNGGVKFRDAGKRHEEGTEPNCTCKPKRNPPSSEPFRMSISIWLLSLSLSHSSPFLSRFWSAFWGLTFGFIYPTGDFVYPHR